MHDIRSLVGWSTGDPNGGIVCRRCESVFPLDEGSCPECGTSVRGLLPPVVVVATGLVVLLPSLSPFDPVSVLLALVLLWLGLHVVRDRRDRIRDAADRRRSGRSGARNVGQR